MTREEEIKKEALFNCNDIAGEVDYKSTAAYEGFIRGAEWADKTMIDKACEWLKEVFVYLSNESSWNIQTNDYNSFQEMIEDFRKSMKGEQP